MSDEFDGIFQRLRGQRPPAAFAVPQAVRRRGRRRSQHQALAAGLAVVAMAAGTGWAAGLLPVDRSTPAGPASTATAPSPGPSSVPSPSVAPSPSHPGAPWPSATPSGPVDLRDRMLRAADLGPGSWRSRPPTEPFDRDRWHWTSSCPEYVSTDYPSLRHQEEPAVTGFAAGASLDAPYVFEHVHRYAAGWGPRAVDDVRRAVRMCQGPPDPRRTVVAERFAGDDALLVREEFRPVGAPALVTLAAVVRVGDLVATVLLSPDRDEQYARTVAAAAVQRLAGG